MDVLNQEESPSLDSGMLVEASSDPNSNADPLTPSPNDNNNDSIPRTTFAGDELDGEFTTAHNHPQLRAFCRYARSITSLAFAILLDTTTSNNKSLVSKIVRIVSTVFLYETLYIRGTGMMLWAIAYLMDHGWYLLAATCSVVLLLLCCGLLVVLEWMWAWQGRAISFLGDGSSSSGYNRLRSVTVLDDDEMEDDLTLKGWIRHIFRALVSCLIWSLYCAGNVKMDFWIMDSYTEARPNHFKMELRLINSFLAAPILLGAAMLLYVAYPSFYRWHSLFERLSDYSRGVENNATNFASSEELASETFTIQVDDDDNEMSMGVGMQNLII